MDLTDRLNVAISHSGLKRMEIAARMDVVPSTITFWKKGQTSIGKKAPKLAEILKVPEEWLVEGTGPAPEWLAEVEAKRPDTLQIAAIKEDMTLKELRKQTEILENIDKTMSKIMTQIVVNKGQKK